MAAHLVVLPSAGASFVVPLDRDVVTIGSAETATVRLVDPEIAGTHAEIRVEGKESARTFLLVRHAPPLLVNGLKVRQHWLHAHDLVTFGKTAIAFRPGAAPGAQTTARADRAYAIDLCRRLVAFGEAVASGAAREALAKRLLDDVLALTGATRGAILQLEAGEARSVFLSSLLSPARRDLSDDESEFSRTVLARMRDAGKAVLVADTRLDGALALAPSLLAEGGRSVLCAPIHDGGLLVGALYASAPLVSPLSPESRDVATLYAAQAARVLAAAEEEKHLRARLASTGQPEPQSLGLVGASSAMRAVAARVKKVAPAELPVLLLGETGTGKEVVARAIHAESARAAGPFVAVHCGAIPGELLASELFGHVKGAFTSAQRDRVGLLRSAEGGTLFLDEIGEMPLAQQVALLRALQERVITPVGGEAPLPVDFRLVSATHRDLSRDVAEGRFRQDLYFRIAGVTVELPPLRERDDDVVLLASHFLRLHAQAAGRPELRLGEEALSAIRAARWDGNVRELEAAVRKAVVLAEEGVVTPADLGLAAPPPEAALVQPLALARDAYLKKYVQSVVDRFGGNRSAAAEALLVSVRTVFKYLEEI